MAHTGLAQFHARWVESAAYNEAGHITAAVLQGMHLRERGIHVDSHGSGISYYWHRLPGNLANSEQDRLERERTIVALYAGPISQKTFFPDCPEEDWISDRATICALLRESCQNESAPRATVENSLQKKAEELVSKSWLVIEGLASILLAKPETPLALAEVEQRWSRGKNGLEKWMNGSEVKAFFKKSQIVASIRREDVE
jgi:hypothetical protein